MKDKGKRGNAGIRKLPKFLIALAVLLTMGVSSMTYAAGNGSDSAEAQVRSATVSDENAYIADTETKDSYEASLGGANSTRYDGRVWVDKSVSSDDVTFSGINKTIENDSDFLVTYSALATSTQMTGENKVPTDTVFIVDLSGSMSNEDSDMDDKRIRIAHVVDALNESIDTLMSANPDSRVAVVGYSNSATVLLPLDHYQKVTLHGQQQQYFSLDTKWPSNDYATLTIKAAGKNNNDISKNISVSGGTNIQMGVYTGMNILATAAPTAVKVGEQTVNSVPSVVLMSDGAATYSSDSVSWWAPEDNNNDGPGSGAYYGNGMKAMMTAAYMKEAIDRNYEPSNSNYAVKVYTIGIGTADLNDDDERNLVNITLNPTEH